MSRFFIIFLLPLFFIGCEKNNKQLASIDDIEKEAKMFTAFLNQNDIHLDCSFKGLQTTEEYLESLPEHEQIKLTNQIASYLGECIIHTYGGEWVLHDNVGWAIKFSDQSYVFPFSSVSQYIESPEIDSYASLFSMIPIILEIQ